MEFKGRSSLQGTAFKERVRRGSVMTRDDWREWRAEASRSRQMKTMTGEQRAYFAMQREIAEHMQAMFDGEAVLHFPERSPVPVYPTGVTPAMQECVGYYWDNGSLFTTTFDRFMRSTMHLTRSAFLLGGTGRGKSQLLRRCGAYFAHGYAAPCFLYSKALDTLGALTKNGMLNTVGAVLLSDFKTVSAGEVPLDLESLKSLVDVFEGGSFLARYARVQLKKKVPRLFAIQGHKWLSENGLECLRHVAERKLDQLKWKPEQIHEPAICRRAVLFEVPDEVVTEAARTALQEDDRAMLLKALTRLGVDELEAQVAEAEAAEAEAPAADAV